MKIKVLDISVKIDEGLEVIGRTASVNMISFHGYANSAYFNGAVLSGAVDTQIQKNGEKRILSARYILEGTDITGTPCHIFIENTGIALEHEIITTPRIITDSQILSFLETAPLEGRVIPKDNGVVIEIYETLFDCQSETHTFSVENKQIYGEFYLPSDGKNMHPLLIASHGYNSCCAHLRNILQIIAGHGIAVYAYDFCGGGSMTKSTGTSTEMSIATEQLDLQAVFSEISKLNGINSEQIYLYGESQGGFVTALTAPKFFNQVKGLFLIYPAFCIPDDWAEVKKSNTATLIEFNGMTIGKRYIDEIPDYDVFEYASQYPGPVTIFHGENDGLVPVGYSQKLANSYQNAILWTYPNQGHGFDEYYLHITAEHITRTIFSL